MLRKRIIIFTSWRFTINSCYFPWHFYLRIFITLSFDFIVVLLWIIRPSLLAIETFVVLLCYMILNTYVHVWLKIRIVFKVFHRFDPSTLAHIIYLTPFDEDKVVFEVGRGVWYSRNCFAGKRYRMEKGSLSVFK